MNKYFSLNSTIDSNRPPVPEDSLKVKKALHKLGYMGPPSLGPEDVVDTPFLFGIRSFQREEGLKVDGVMKPKGETETALNHVLNLNAQPIKGPSNPKPSLPKEHAERMPNIVPPKAGIQEGVGIGKRNQPKDMDIVKKQLEIKGYRSPEANAVTNDVGAELDLIYGIKQFQKGNGLKVDGKVNPKGETIESLTKGRQQISPLGSFTTMDIDIEEEGGTTQVMEKENGEGSPICKKINEDFTRVQGDILEAGKILVEYQNVVESALKTLIAIEEVTKSPDFQAVKDLAGKLGNSNLINGMPQIKIILQGAHFALSLAEAFAPYLVGQLQSIKDSLVNVEEYIEVSKKALNIIISDSSKHKCGPLIFPDY